MKIKFNSQITNGFLIGILLAVFFVAGFMVKGQFSSSGRVQTQYNNSKTVMEENETLIKEEVISKVKNYLSTKLPPFVVNISTISLEKDKNIEGIDYLYNWKAVFTVEPNSYGNWATNETTERPYNFYLSKNGNYIFYSAPEPTEVKKTNRELVYNK